MPPKCWMANRTHRALLCSFRAATFSWNPYPGRRSRLRRFALPRADMLGPVGPKRRCNNRRIGTIESYIVTHSQRARMFPTPWFLTTIPTASRLRSCGRSPRSVVQYHCRWCACDGGEAPAADLRQPPTQSSGRTFIRSPELDHGRSASHFYRRYRPLHTWHDSSSWRHRRRPRPHWCERSSYLSRAHPKSTL